jgi:hypothetical protein
MYNAYDAYNTYNDEGPAMSSEAFLSPRPTPSGRVTEMRAYALFLLAISVALTQARLTRRVSAPETVHGTLSNRRTQDGNSLMG